MSGSFDATHSAVMAIAGLALQVPGEDVRAAIGEIHHTDAVMPIVDPTGYRAIMKNVPEHLELLEAFLAFRSTVAK
ncbi:MAG: hypothetical protein GX657_15400, partial [Chloroflexi bacterium]|nr:hypothetical protein [Chloroflexota bacterium]